eukprot:SAG31_NODE_35000_length_327_cov_0.877193_1_plen_49_part_10
MSARSPLFYINAKAWIAVEIFSTMLSTFNSQLMLKSQQIMSKDIQGQLF